MLGSFFLAYFCTQTLFAKGYEKAKGETENWRLVWEDEFNKPGKPNSKNWSFEQGFVRNNEEQWYSSENAFCENGMLIIEARKENRPNPNFDSTSTDWRKKRPFAQYTSACLKTKGLKQFKYGRFEVRARIDTSIGLWPAIWTLGEIGRWPSNGEIDIMESYPLENRQHILANVACAFNEQFEPKWNSKKIPLSYFLQKNHNWPNQFHIWRMDWDERSIKLYLDDELLNEVLLIESVNFDGVNPFQQPHYILLNMAVGGNRGGDPSRPNYPARFEIDYVKVYQKKSN